MNGTSFRNKRIEKKYNMKCKRVTNENKTVARKEVLSPGLSLSKRRDATKGFLYVFTVSIQFYTRKTRCTDTTKRI